MTEKKNVNSKGVLYMQGTILREEMTVIVVYFAVNDRQEFG